VIDIDKIIEFSIKIKTPTYIKQQKFIGNIYGTLKYIPGSTIFGAIGNYLLRNYCNQFKSNQFKSVYENCRKCTSKCEFFEAILSKDKIICNDATFIERNNSFKDDEYIRNLKSLTICRKDKNHIQDALLYYLQTKELSLPLCKTCNNPMKRGSKSVYLLMNGGKHFILKSLEPNVIMLTTTGVDRTTLSVREGILFRLECIEPDQIFTTKILVNESIVDIIKEALNGLDNYGIGGSRNRGFGRIEINILKERSTDEYISNRKDLVIKNSEILSNNLDYLPEGHNAVIITFKSDLNLLPFSFIPDGMEFTHLLNSRLSKFGIKLQSNEIQLIRFFGKKGIRAHFSEQNQMNSMLINQIEAGSSLVYSYPKSINDDFFGTLIYAELYHIGWNPERGFGQFICNSNIHFKGGI